MEVKQIQYFDYHYCGKVFITFECYHVFPGMCININDFTYEYQDNIPLNNFIQEKILLSNGGEILPSIRLYQKTNLSPIYQVTIVKGYNDYYFMLQQVSFGYQAVDLTVESGLIKYDYPKKEVAATKTEINLTEKDFQKYYPYLNDPENKYSIVKNPTLEMFKRYEKERK